MEYELLVDYEHAVAGTDVDEEFLEVSCPYISCSVCKIDKMLGNRCRDVDAHVEAGYVKIING